MNIRRNTGARNQANLLDFNPSIDLKKQRSESRSRYPRNIDYGDNNFLNKIDQTSQNDDIQNRASTSVKKPYSRPQLDDANTGDFSKAASALTNSASKQ